MEEYGFVGVCDLILHIRVHSHSPFWALRAEGRRVFAQGTFGIAFLALKRFIRVFVSRAGTETFVLI